MAFLDEMMTDRITEEARQVDIGRVFLAVLAAVFVAVGKAWALAVTAVAWVFVAMRTGYRDVRPVRAQLPARR